MKGKHYLVTGGSGFIGSALVRRLVHGGARVTVLDDGSRGKAQRIADIAEQVRVISGDIRDPDIVREAAQEVDSVLHLAFINGTEFFYSNPDLVLDVGVKGMVNVIDACRLENVKELVLASSSEVYQTQILVPTPEEVPLIVPDPHNPRYSYGAGKIISEVMTLNYGVKYFDRVLIFRPHNVFGPDMGWEHVIPQFAVRMAQLSEKEPRAATPLRFPIQGSGLETRSFIYIEDFVDGFMTMLQQGEHLGIYHIGTMEEVSIATVARMVGRCFQREIELVPSSLRAGGTLRRCPDIRKLRTLGFEPRYSLATSLPLAVDWYVKHLAEAPRANAQF